MCRITMYSYQFFCILNLLYSWYELEIHMEFPYKLLDSSYTYLKTEYTSAIVFVIIII